MPPSLSVITPSFQQGRFIRRTIESVLTQDIDCTYVVMDGGSNDETVSILKEYETELTWVSEKDRGQAHAVNKGIAATDGEIICWLNSDDVYFPGALKKVQEFFEENPDVDFLYGRAYHIDEVDGFINEYPTEPWNAERMEETCFFCQPAVFFRRRVVEKMGDLDEQLNFCMDYEYWLRAIKSGMTFRYYEDVLAGSRFYETNKTLGSRQSVHAEINSMLKNTLGHVNHTWLTNHAYTIAKEDPLYKRGSTVFAWRLEKEIIKGDIRWNRIPSWAGIRKFADLSFETADILYIQPLKSNIISRFKKIELKARDYARPWRDRLRFVLRGVKRKLKHGNDRKSP